MLVVGYGLHSQVSRAKSLAENTPATVVESVPKGPPLAHVVIDEPTLEGHDDYWRRGEEHFEAGINGLSVVIELRNRKDADSKRACCR
jgi:hypothetical protein